MQAPGRSSNRMTTALDFVRRHAHFCSFNNVCGHICFARRAGQRLPAIYRDRYRDRSATLLVVFHGSAYHASPLPRFESRGTELFLCSLHTQITCVDSGRRLLHQRILANIYLEYSKAVIKYGAFSMSGYRVGVCQVSLNILSNPLFCMYNDPFFSYYATAIEIIKILRSCTVDIYTWCKWPLVYCPIYLRAGS